MKKYIPRIYTNNHLDINEIFYLSKDHIHYIKEVLRMKNQDILEIFNNTNYIFLGKIINIKKKIIEIQIFESKLKNIESPLHIHLGQVILNYKNMDFVIQKSIELGIKTITPLLFDNCNFQKNIISISKKIQHWKKIAISSCQQCKRNIIPEIKYPEKIFSWCKNNKENNINILFHPKSTLTLNELPKSIKCIQIIVGSEKGFSDNDIKKIIKYGFISIKLGPRILRAETASIAAITALQTKFGDLI